MTKKYLFTKRNTVILPADKGENNVVLATTALKNLESLGYILDKNGVDSLKTATKDSIESWYFETEKLIREVTGADEDHTLFYPNFPNDLMETSEVERVIDQLLYYLVEDIQPVGKNEKEHIKSLESHTVKILATVSESEANGIIMSIFKNICVSKQTPNVDDWLFVQAFCDTHEDWVSHAQTIENRNLLSALYARALVEKKPTHLFPALVTNDYLRIAKVLGKYKETHSYFLPLDEYKIVSISNSYRKILLKGLETQKNLEEDVARDIPAWKVFFKMTHVGSYPQFVRLNEVAYKCRNNIPLQTFYGKVEKAYQEKRGFDLIRLYESRPGEFIANIGRLFTLIPNTEKERESYSTALSKACINVFSKARMEDLVKVLQYLKSRTREDRFETRCLYGREGVQTPIHSGLYDAVFSIIRKIIIERLSSLEFTGKFYISPELSKWTLHKKKEDSSSSLASYGPGTHIPVERNEDGSIKNIRLMMYFENNQKPRWGNIVDISVAFFKEEEDILTPMGTLAWFNSSREVFHCWHSGDWIGAPENGGAFECIDLNVEELIKAGVTHVMFHSNVWSGGSFDHEHVTFGWQEREELDKSSQFDIRAVKQHSLLTGKAMGNIPGILNLTTGEILWTDYADKQATPQSDVRNAIKYAPYLLDRYGKGDMLTMDVFAEWIAEAVHAELVDNPEDADVLFLPSAYKEKKEEQTVIKAGDQDVWLSFLSL